MTNLSKEKLKILKDSKHNIKVIAGPGSGKTTLIVEKVKRLIESGVNPKKILVITYTNKAAEELEKRICEKIKKSVSPYVSTVHGFCTRFIKENPEGFKEYKGYKILDELNQTLMIVKFIKRIKSGESIQKKSVKELWEMFSRIKDNFFKNELENLDPAIKEAYLEYCEVLNERRSFDFADLINIVCKSINEKDSLKKISKSKFNYILVDEYQDFNRIQELLLECFIGKKTKLFVVGDKNQSIYGFRGSDVRIFDNFEKVFVDVKIYYLKKNYRSTERIIELSNKFFLLSGEEEVKPNKEKEDGKITEKGDRLKAIRYPNSETEAKETVRYLKDLFLEKKLKSYSDVAILFRSVKNNSKRFVEELKKEKIPFEVIGDGSLFQNEYIRELINCFKQIVEEEVVESEIWGISEDKSLFEKEIEKGPQHLFYKLLEKSSYFKELLLQEREDILFNLGKFSKILEAYQSTFGKEIGRLVEGLNKIDKSFLNTKQPPLEIKESVKIMTLHGSKGLEFPLVILPSMTKDTYKLFKKDVLASIFTYYDPEKDLERAFYVGMTRAKKVLRVSFFGRNASKFLNKLLNRNSHLIDLEVYNNTNLNEFLGKEEKEEGSSLETKEISEEIIELTHYKLIEFWKCSYAYKLRFYYDFVMPPTAQLFYGSKIHNLLYYINLAIKNNKVYTWENIKEYIPKNLEKNYEYNKRKIENYLMIFKKELRSEIFPEFPFEIAIKNAIIRGRVDLLVKERFGKGKILEFKSGMRKTEIEGNALNQLSLYSLALKEQNVKKGSVYFFGDNSKKEVVFDQNQIKLNLMTAIDSISNNEFHPNNEKCDQCVFSQYKLCPHYKEPKYKANYQEDVDSELEIQEEGNPRI